MYIYFLICWPYFWNNIEHLLRILSVNQDFCLTFVLRYLLLLPFRHYNTPLSTLFSNDSLKTLTWWKWYPYTLQLPIFNLMYRTILVLLIAGIVASSVSLKCLGLEFNAFSIVLMHFITISTISKKWPLFDHVHIGVNSEFAW